MFVVCIILTSISLEAKLKRSLLPEMKNSIHKLKNCSLRNLNADASQQYKNPLAGVFKRNPANGFFGDDRRKYREVINPLY